MPLNTDAISIEDLEQIAKGYSAKYTVDKEAIPKIEFNLAMIYYEGKRVRKDLTAAINWAEKAADNNNIHSKCFLVDIYTTKGTENWERVLYLTRQILDDPNIKDIKHINDSNRIYLAKPDGSVESQQVQGTIFHMQSKLLEAQWRAGQIYLQKGDVKFGIELLTKAGERGHPDAQLALFNFYQDEKTKDEDKKNYWYEKLALRLDTQKKAELAMQFFQGKVRPKNNEKGFFWMKCAAEEGSVSAQSNLSKYYQQIGDSLNAIYWSKRSLKVQDGFRLNAPTQLATQVRLVELYMSRYEHVHALYWAEIAAKQGNIYAQMMAAYLFRDLPRYQNYGKSFYYFKRASQQTDDKSKNFVTSAEVCLGWMYEHGLGILAPNPEQAFTYYEKAAGKDDAEALNNLGSLYLRGVGVQQNFYQAKIHFEQSAKQNFAAAHNSLGWIHENGLGVSQDHKQARIHYEQASKLLDDKSSTPQTWLYETGGSITKYYYQSVACAYYHLGRLHEQGLGGDLDTQAAIICYQQAAALGYQKARYALCHIESQTEEFNRDYQLGVLCLQDKKYQKALGHFEKSAANNFAAALNNLGWMHENSLGVAQNYEVARAWYAQAIKQSVNDKPQEEAHPWVYTNGGEIHAHYYQAVAVAYYNLARLLEKGLGGPVEKEQAKIYYKNAAALGYKEAEKALDFYTVNAANQQEYRAAQTATQYALGLRYFKGDDQLPQNYQYALQHFIAAGSEQCAEAQYHLATIYSSEFPTIIPQVKKNDSEAFKWCIKAAQNGHLQAQYFLAQMYATGRSYDTTLAKELLKGLCYVQVSGDGHGLFHAVGLYLNQDDKFLRQIVAAHLENNIETYSSYYAQEYNKDINQHIADIRDGKEWGTQIEIEIIQLLSDRPIIIIKPNANPTIPEQWAKYKGSPIFIYCNGHSHYDVFTIEAGHEGKNILAAIQAQIEQGSIVVYNPDPISTNGVKDEISAARWYEKAATEGHVLAQVNLGYAYEKGIMGIAQNDEQAIAWYRKAAHQENAYGYFYLANMHRMGRVTQNDPASAEPTEVTLFKKAASEIEGIKNATKYYDNIEGMLAIALIYEQGYGVEKNLAEAVIWYKMAAEKNNAVAQYHLAILYKNGGPGIAKEESKAEQLFRQAVALGHEGANTMLKLIEANKVSAAQSSSSTSSSSSATGLPQRTFVSQPSTDLTSSVKKPDKNLEKRRTDDQSKSCLVM